MRRFALTFLYLLIFWMLFAGKLTYEEFVLGTFVSLAIAQMTYRFVIPERGDINTVDRVLALLRFTIVFIVEEIKAHIFLLRAVITGKSHAGVVVLKKPFKSEFANFVVLNGITLTPGTLTVEVKDDDAIIHCFNVKRSKNVGRSFMKTLKGAFK